MTVDTALPPIAPPIPSAGSRLAARVIQIGAVAAVLAVGLQKAFELDRFLITKELVLHVTALIAGIFAIGALRRIAVSRLDWLLALYLVLSAASVALATNRWLALRAFTVSASAIAIFWIARALRDASLASRVLRGIALAVVIACITSLMQAYGVRTDFFSINRSPGGTLGNRNFVAHAAAFGFPVCLLIALRARKKIEYLMSSIGIAIVAAALVLTRSRAAYLAAAVMLAVFFFALVFSRPLRGLWGRMFGVLAIAAIGVAAALLLPNTLRWRSDNPYLESVQGVVNYEQGSGAGRLVQYEHTLRMAVFHPLFGVGPGNWPVEYPDNAARNDPSLDTSEPGTTFNPWPSSDWVAFIAERGFAAAIALALAFASMAFGAFRRMFAAVDPDDAIQAAALLGVLAAAIVAGLFDAVLLLGLPALLVWAALGALYAAPPAATRTMHAPIALIMIVLAAIGAARSATQLVAMNIYATTSSRASLERAAVIDPGNYRVQLRLARGGARRSRCDHARAAHSLFPYAEEARQLSAGCGR